MRAGYTRRRRRQGSHLHRQQSGHAHTRKKREMTRLTGGIGGKSRMLVALSARLAPVFANQRVIHPLSFSRHIPLPRFPLHPAIFSLPTIRPTSLLLLLPALWRDRTGGLNNNKGNFAAMEYSAVCTSRGDSHLHDTKQDFSQSTKSVLFFPFFWNISKILRSRSDLLYLIVFFFLIKAS